MKSAKIHYYAVDPFSLNEIKELAGIQSGGSVDFDLDSDGVVSGKLDTRGTDWERGQLIRITYEIDGTEHRLATLTVSQGDEKIDSYGIKTSTLTLQSQLTTLKDNKTTSSYVIANGTTVDIVINQIASDGFIHFDMDNSKLGGYRYNDNVYYDAGTDLQTIFYDAIGKGDNEALPQPDGVIRIDDKVNRFFKTPSVTFRLGERNANVFDDVSHKLGGTDKFNRFIITSKSNGSSSDTGEVLSAYFDDDLSIFKDGRIIATSSTTNTDNATIEQLRNEAEQAYRDAQSYVDTWELSTKLSIVPSMSIGDGAELILPDGEKHTGYISKISITLNDALDASVTITEGFNE